MPIRPLLLVAALAGGDYLLWTWSSDGGSTTVALISGLALAPLLLALLWLASLTIARLLLLRTSRPRPASTKRPPGASPRRAIPRLLSEWRRRRRSAQWSVPADLWEEEKEQMPGRSAVTPPTSEKLAA